jgi:hypothetical protein
MGFFKSIQEARDDIKNIFVKLVLMIQITIIKFSYLCSLGFNRFGGFNAQIQSVSDTRKLSALAIKELRSLDATKTQLCDFRFDQTCSFNIEKHKTVDCLMIRHFECGRVKTEMSQVPNINCYLSFLSAETVYLLF